MIIVGSGLDRLEKWLERMADNGKMLDTVCSWIELHRRVPTADRWPVGGLKDKRICGWMFDGSTRCGVDGACMGEGGGVPGGRNGTNLRMDVRSLYDGGWMAYVDTNLVGTKKITRAAIHGLDGSLWATSKGFSVGAMMMDSLVGARVERVGEERKAGPRSLPHLLFVALHSHHPSNPAPRA
ncbi:hypothetical protein BDK51DRAFT_37631 [Blyttiomyces helicus]|uniref:Uncharacterized protein n=1 Tax=Blyttiomyces helicus TaxID=388810 RepID=A0A4P9VWV3_9FUNG|nr:hypothetical protein BDK51DRAFT_37631 [Blyttiomyces helicus]|eukprot:RKO83682.1 hypothetical protein BDK51DRAFT_37631 [Blyttiomyces helicus]